MKVLLAGANSYIGMMLIPVLLEKGHEVVCLVSDKKRFYERNNFAHQVTLLTGDLLREQSIEAFPADIEVAYYLVHSMAQSQDLAALEALSAYNFIHALDQTGCCQTIFLSGISNGKNQSKQADSRKHIEDVLKEGKSALTILRAAMIIGWGSTSFEIIRNLTEKLTVMTVPGWVNSRCQPIAIRDVLTYLESVMLNEKTFNRSFEIGGPDILTFKEMILGYAQIRQLKRHIITIPFLPSGILSYWLSRTNPFEYAVTHNLASSLKDETIMHEHSIEDIVPSQCLTYKESLLLAINHIQAKNNE
ncbi:NAD(P)H-binding protein [Mucilaginibacter sp. HC2]|uniref:NAD(P)H-binding protein n=1 Tax=Mucilaginibacter inviolabilis TaxID=2714892 RepID=UPI001408367D|nr:NAD(P)H-binding protein [Mucilaginibacter inviolabilis]NHA08022.1 NAD(P)H-binding protein [Mucilaginibacter inviolabilis]